MEPKGEQEFFEALQRHKLLTESINKRVEKRVISRNESRVTAKDAHMHRSKSQYESFMKNKKPKGAKKQRRRREEASKTSDWDRRSKGNWAGDRSKHAHLATSHHSKKRSRTYEKPKSGAQSKQVSARMDKHLLSQTGNSQFQESRVSRSNPKAAKKASGLYGYKVGNSKYHLYKGTSGFSNLNDHSLYSNLLSQAPFDVKNSNLSRKQSNRRVKNIYSRKQLNSKKDTNTSNLSNVSRQDFSVRKMRSVKSSKVNKSRVKKGKGRVDSLFEPSMAEVVDLAQVVDNWTLLVLTLEDLRNEPRVTTLANTYFLRTFLKQYGNFALLFSGFNNIRQRVQEMMILEFWTFYSLFYFIHEEGGIEPLSLANLEVVLTLLVRSIYYISLILIKARKSQILKLPGKSLNKFNFLMKKFKFPSGVPLIKTIKEGNATIRERIRKVLFYTSRKVRRQFEWTLEHVALNFEHVIGLVAEALSSELKRKSRKVFIQMNLTEFFSHIESYVDSQFVGNSRSRTMGIFENSNLENGPDATLKTHIEFHTRLSEKYTAREFLLNSLTETTNSNSLLISLRQRHMHALPKKKWSNNKRSLKNGKTAKTRRNKKKFSTANSRVSNANSVRESLYNQQRKFSETRRSKVASTRPNRRKETHSKGISNSRSGFKASSVSSKSRRVEHKFKEPKNNFKMTNLLSGLSTKYQPLSNVSELRDSAMSVKRDQERKKKGKRKKTKKKKARKANEDSKTGLKDQVRAHRPKNKTANEIISKQDSERSLRDKINRIRSRINEQPAQKQGTSDWEVDQQKKSPKDASSSRKKSRGYEKVKPKMNTSGDQDQEKSIFSRRRKNLLNAEVITKKSVKPKTSQPKTRNVFKRSEMSIQDQSKVSNQLGQTSTTILKEKSIVPSESYTKVVGKGSSKGSPKIKTNLVTRVTVNSTVMNESEYFNSVSRSQRRRKQKASHRPSKSVQKPNQNVAQRRAELQQNYAKTNTMSHTPDPKSKGQSMVAKLVQRSQTPETKKTGALEPGRVDMFPMQPLLHRKFTLVLDLDETLIHFKTENGKSKFLIRPHTYKFLRNLYPHFELIIFTAAQKQYADWIIDKIDTKKYISYRFYRTHCQMSRSAHVKDLTKLSRNLKHMLIVDNCKENFKLQKESGIHIKGWFGNTADRVLVGLEKMLIQMAQSDPADVRFYLHDLFKEAVYDGLSLY